MQLNFYRTNVTVLLFSVESTMKNNKANVALPKKQIKEKMN